MQLGLEKDLRPIAQDFVSLLKDLHEREISQKNLIIVKLVEENKKLKEKLGEK